MIHTWIHISDSQGSVRKYPEITCIFSSDFSFDGRASSQLTVMKRWERWTQRTGLPFLAPGCDDGWPVYIRNGYLAELQWPMNWLVVTGTWMEFLFHSVGNFIMPIDELIFFRKVEINNQSEWTSMNQLPMTWPSAYIAYYTYFVDVLPSWQDDTCLVGDT